MKHTKTEWFISGIGESVEPSFAENLIRTALNSLNIKHVTEVSFYGLKFDTGNYARFDFYIPKMNLVIEYDGKEYHNTKEVKKRDRIKTQFCKSNGIGLIRLNNKHYANIEVEILKAIKLHNTPTKQPLKVECIAKPKKINRKKLLAETSKKETDDMLALRAKQKAEFNAKDKTIRFSFR